MQNKSAGKKVLIADDNPAILRILSVSLGNLGYSVTTVEGGQAALDAIEADVPDVMLLDIYMPNVDGFEVLRKLRAKSELPVIVFSARPSQWQKALALGANDFIAKPFLVDEVSRCIEIVLEHSK